MKNKIAFAGLGLLALAVTAVAGFATVQFTNYSQQLLANVFDRQLTSPSYGDPWQERFRLASCTLYKEKVSRVTTGAESVGKSLEKVRDLKCNDLQKEMGKQAEGSYFIQSTYFDALMHLIGYSSYPDFNVLTPIAISKGSYKCDFEAQGWKTVYSAMPYGRLGMTTSASFTEPQENTYNAGSMTTLIVEEQKGRQTIPHDFNICPTVGKLEGSGISGGEVRFNWGFVSQKIMNMLIIQPDSISYYDASGNKVKSFANGDYTFSLPDVYKDFKFTMHITGKQAPSAPKAVETTPATTK